jgi:hypothetical protein
LKAQFAGDIFAARGELPLLHGVAWMYRKWEAPAALASNFAHRHVQTNESKSLLA